MVGSRLEVYYNQLTGSIPVSPNILPCCPLSLLDC
jgi:hypothetical protein